MTTSEIKFFPLHVTLMKGSLLGLQLINGKLKVQGWHKGMIRSNCIFEVNHFALNEPSDTFGISC